jgi:hypothetical protein
MEVSDDENESGDENLDIQEDFQFSKVELRDENTVEDLVNKRVKQISKKVSCVLEISLF